ncbi:hypothetical protein BMF90_17925 [Serratia sp. OLHL2]|nr:hypothetical protein BMF92_24655 [Serratia sp. OLBL1]PII50198.1 hypothetical protein BMF85_24435 [Serratia sp. OLCL1]PII50550.1 hypothetical protein BMF87_18305 [Serratia sp. OLEL1]PII61062.1 hypothetical protein BMF90_17925 [Serratia sp. OLHL2]PII66178.1 hypothetical protein BMH23_24520 [Serratia sp. OLIL2]PII68907.1 hypothetical protein BMF88_24945 [Serratia sp. OLDL1]PII82591.1 hypothetical protein BMF91_24990 [Serratia sp. OLFL2]PIJ26525.1 hypothetical protein BVV03_00845 [Serratia sp
MSKIIINVNIINDIILILASYVPWLTIFWKTIPSIFGWFILNQLIILLRSIQYKLSFDFFNI